MKTAVGQGRLRQPDPLVQGPGRRRRAGRRPPTRLHRAGLPVTGNLANAVAAAAARAGIRSVVLIPSNLEQQKILTTAAYGGTLVAVDGNYDDINRLAGEIAAEQEDWAFVNVNVRPYYAEGSKTLGLRGRRTARLAAAAAGGHPDRLRRAAGQGRQGLHRAGELGLVEPTPYKVFGAQATGCSPVSAAFKAGEDTVRPVRPDTIAKSLAIGNPADGPYVLDVTRRTGGPIEDVSDDEVIDGHQAAGPHRGHLRRDRRRRHHRRAAQAAGDRAARPGGRDRRLQHR